MDVRQIRQLKPMLTRYLKQFDDCFARRDTRAHFSTYVEGQLSDRGEKSCEPIALAAGIPPRNLQEFLSTYKWEEDRTRNRLQEIVIRDHSGRNSVGVIDETSDVKQGDKTPGVQRQWCGTVGKKENCIVTVHLGYANGDFHCLVDGDLFLPEAWSSDRDRCRAAGIPDDVVYRPKWRMALDLLDRVMSHGVQFQFLVADEAYGSIPAFRQGVAERELIYVLEVPRSVLGWLKVPEVHVPPLRTPLGRPPSKPRLVHTAPKARRVDQLWRRGGPSWKRFHVKNTDKGPEVWEARVVRFTPCVDQLPQDECWLLVARHALTGEIKYFLSNAPESTAPEVLLHVAFSRWHIERLFEDGKSHVGLDHFEVRNYLPILRHLILSMVSLLFLAQQTHRLREKKSPLDRAPSTDCRRSAA